MLREIINFTKSISPSSYDFRLLPVEGIHIQVKLDEKGNFLNYQYEFYKKGYEVTKFLKDCIRLQNLTKCVSMNKAFDSKKKIHSCSPFCVAFKIKSQKEVKSRFDDYFKTAVKYCEDEKYKKWAELFHNFSKKQLLQIVENAKSKINEEQTQKDKRFKFADKYYIYVYLSNLDIKNYESVYKQYLSDKVFLKDDYNISIGNDVFGVTDYLSGYNLKKPFLQHRTATFDINYLISNNDALVLFRFSQLQANKLLPKPLPIFIDKEELNDTVVKIFNREGNDRIKFSDIITQLYEREGDLGNYYLLNYFGQKVRDFDFVSSFSFKLKPSFVIHDLFGIKNGVQVKLDDIFSFEKYIVQRIFDNQLVQKSKDSNLRLRYFDDIEYKPQYISATMFQLVLKYRKAFYDYIYKSKRQALNSRIFHDIMKTGILDDLRQDKYENNNHSKGYQIKEKLNIWFSMYEFFNKKKNGEETMANKIKKLQIRMQEIASDANQHLESDEEFAYAAGQVIYYLLNCSEASNKTHALLEPFLQKSDLAQFKMAISRVFNQYKHAISFYKGKFEKLMAEVLSYEIDKDLKELTPLILAGYFANNVIFMKNE